jgi:hypothetical protein
VGTTNYEPATDLPSDEATPQAHIWFISGQRYHNSYHLHLGIQNGHIRSLFPNKISVKIKTVPKAGH